MACNNILNCEMLALLFWIRFTLCCCGPVHEKSSATYATRGCSCIKNGVGLGFFKIYL